MLLWLKSCVVSIRFLYIWRHTQIHTHSPLYALFAYKTCSAFLGGWGFFVCVWVNAEFVTSL